MPSLELAALAYLRHVLRVMKVTPSALAKRAGLSSTTLTRALNDPEHKFTLTTTTIQKIADASGINPAPFLNAGDVGELSATHLYDAENVYDPKKWSSDFFGGLQSTLVIGEIAFDVWIEPEVFSSVKYGNLPLALPPFKPSDCFGCVVKDQSVDRYARGGETLFCARFEKLKLSSPSLVIVERRDPQRFLVELTCRILRKVGDRWRLEFASHSKNFSEVIELDSLEARPDLKIFGSVLFVVRDLQQLPQPK